MYVLGMLVPNLVIGFLLLRLCGGIYGCKYPESVYFGMYIFMTVYQCFVAFLNIPFLPVVTLSCIAGFLVKTGYTGPNNKIVYPALFMVYLGAVYMFLTPFPVNNPGIEFWLTWIIGAITALFAYQCILKFVMGRSVKALMRNQELLLVLISGLELWVIHMAVQSGNGNLIERNLIVPGLSVVFLAVDAYFVLLFENVSRKNELEAQVCMDERYLEQMKDENENYRKVMHDIKKHLRMMKEKETTDPVYCDEALGLVNWPEVSFRCSNPVLTRILNDCLLRCEACGIETKLEIDDVRLEFMRKSDITTIFMNLLDNAIEACDEADDKRITIKMRRIQGNIVTVITNSCKGSGVSSKEGHMGLGLVNVRTALARYGSKLEISQEGQRFISKFIIAENGL